MTKEERLEQRLVYVQAVGHCISTVLTALVIEHVKMGSDPEAAMAKTKKLLDDTLAGFSIEGTAQDGGKHDIGPEIKRRASLILDAVEGDAREALSLPPPVKERH